MTREAPQGDTLTRAMLEELQALRREVEELRADLRRLPSPTPPPDTKKADPHGLRPLVDALRKP